MTLTLHGLTSQQVELCDRLWNCNTEEAVEDLLAMLPVQVRQEAQTLMTMMVQESYEEELSLMERYPDAEEMLERLKKDYL